MSNIIAVTGIRDLYAGDEPVVEREMIEAAKQASGFVFGGARGADTVALAALCGWGGSKLVIVPGRLGQQPGTAQRVAQECASEVRELGLSLRARGSYQTRNLAMLDAATRVLAFWDGASGGTANCLQAARARRMPVEVIPVRRGDAAFPLSALGVLEVGFPCQLQTPYDFPVYALERYQGASRGQGVDPLSALVRQMKAGTADSATVLALGQRLASYLAALSGAVLVPMPRRAPEQLSDLAPLVTATATAGGLLDGSGVLVRHREPQGGYRYKGRQRFTAAEHAATLQAALSTHGRPIVLLDNVLTTGATIEGAVMALRRDLGVPVLVVALLASAGWSCR